MCSIASQHSWSNSYLVWVWLPINSAVSLNRCTHEEPEFQGAGFVRGSALTINVPSGMYFYVFQERGHVAKYVHMSSNK